MSVREFAAYRRALPDLSRFGVFVAASIALHAMTLVASGPSGVSGAPYSGPTTSFLHATIAHLESSARDATAPGAQQREQTVSSAPEAHANAQPRAGTPEGLNLPFPEKWFTAGEVDVRAEPLGEVLLDYPHELTGTGAAGRVQLLLFIDERGIVRKAQVASSAPEGVFDRFALKTWEQVRFSPALKAAVPVKSQKLVELSFTAF